MKFKSTTNFNVPKFACLRLQQLKCSGQLGMRPRCLPWNRCSTLKTSIIYPAIVLSYSTNRIKRRHFSQRALIHWRHWNYAEIYCNANRHLFWLIHWHPNKFRSLRGSTLNNWNSRKLPFASRSNEWQRCMAKSGSFCFSGATTLKPLPTMRKA